MTSGRSGAAHSVEGSVWHAGGGMLRVANTKAVRRDLAFFLITSFSPHSVTSYTRLSERRLSWPLGADDRWEDAGDSNNCSEEDALENPSLSPPT